MSEEKKTSVPAPEKEDSKKAKEGRDNPKKHGSEVLGSEAGGDPGEGRTGTKLGSTDS
jgi:hypothetical protein